MDYHEEGVFPWEEEVKKKSKRIACLPEKTNLKSKVHSKPKVDGQEYLDVYLMMKEKERLERFGRVTGRIQRQTAKNWIDTNKEIAKAEKTLSCIEGTGVEAKRKSEKVRKRTPGKPMKTMVLDY